VVGAGLSGIAAGHYLATRCPDKRIAILEARAALGGTWDLFRFPGIRSDSDMYTPCYSFRPSRDRKAIADGAAILDYLRATAAESGIDRRIRYHRRVESAAWSMERGRWRVSVRNGETGRLETATCNFLWACAPATTATTRATRRSAPPRSGSAGRSSTRRSGATRSSTTASAWSSSAAARPL
jgi:cation diffusion facilitator CzcD-associated flavoprotein CzcO